MSRERFFDSYTELQTLIEAGPTDNSVKRFSELVHDPILHRYAFGAIQDKRWIRPLRSTGYFSAPPEPIRDTEQGTIAYPGWPESQFLARMSAKAPQLVSEIILALPVTDNVMVHRDLLEAALEMPVKQAGQVGQMENQWLKTQNKIFLILISTNCSKLIQRLARGGEQDTAFELSQSLLEVLPDPRLDDNTEEMYLLPEPRTRLDAWEYERVFRSVVPALAEADHMRTLSLTCDLLEHAIVLSFNPNTGSAPEDYSTIWCPEIEHAHGGAPNVKRAVVSAVWETLSLLALESDSVPDLVTRLEERRWNVFRRLALALLRQYPDKVHGLIADRLTDKKLFDDPSFKREYTMLLTSSYETLLTTQKRLILEWIEQGPDIEKYKMNYEKAWGSQPMPQFVVRSQKMWLRDKLAPIQASLTGHWKTVYDNAVSDLLEVEHSMRLQEQKVGVSRSKSSAELRAMAASDITTYLESWGDVRQTEGAIPPEVGQALTWAVAEDPAKFAEQADKFGNLDISLVGALVQGFEQSLRQAGKKQFSWDNILALAQNAIGQSRTPYGTDPQSLDRDAQQEAASRSTIARLLSAGLERQSPEIPYSLRSAISSVLSALSRDPDPTVERELRDSPIDPITLSINSVRGNAIHAVIRFALWIRRFIDSQAKTEHLRLVGFNGMPEVQVLLDEHLNPEMERAISIRAIYGQWLPWLVFLDEKWVTANVERIFPSSEELKLFREAAWNSYIVFCQPFDNVFDIVRSQYDWAVESMGSFLEKSVYRAAPSSQLSTHLMVYYWRGKLALTDSLVKTFYERANAQLRGQSLEFIGKSLKDAKHTDDVPKVVIDRLKELWKWRATTAQLAGSKRDYDRELGAFGWWFSSGKFDVVWSVEELLKALTLVPKTNPSHLVIERLAEISEEVPLQSLSCLKLIVEGDSEGWILAGSEEQCRRILAAGMSANDAPTRAFAEDVIHILGASGYLAFRDLLSR